MEPQEIGEIVNTMVNEANKKMNEMSILEAHFFRAQLQKAFCTKVD